MKGDFIMKKGKRVLLSSAVVLSLLSQASVPVAQVLATETPPASSVTLNQDQLNQYLSEEAKKEILTPLRDGEKVHAEIKDGKLIINFDDDYKVVPDEEIPIYFVQFNESDIGFLYNNMVKTADIQMDNKIVGKVFNGKEMYASSRLIYDFNTLEEFKATTPEKILNFIDKKINKKSKVIKSYIVLNENAIGLKNRRVTIPIIRYEGMEKSSPRIFIGEYYIRGVVPDFSIDRIVNNDKTSIEKGKEYLKLNQKRSAQIIFNNTILYEKEKLVNFTFLNGDTPLAPVENSIRMTIYNETNVKVDNDVVESFNYEKSLSIVTSDNSTLYRSKQLKATSISKDKFHYILKLREGHASINPNLVGHSFEKDMIFKKKPSLIKINSDDNSASLYYYDPKDKDEDVVIKGKVKVLYRENEVEVEPVENIEIPEGNYLSSYNSSLFEDGAIVLNNENILKDFDWQAASKSISGTKAKWTSSEKNNWLFELIDLNQSKTIYSNVIMYTKDTFSPSAYGDSVGSITVKYQDENGNEIKPDFVLKKDEAKGTKYEYTPEVIEGYEYVDYDHDKLPLTGELPGGSHEIVLKYKTLTRKNQLVIRDGEKVVDTIELTGKKGETVSIPATTFDKYREKYQLPENLPTEWRVEDVNTPIEVSVTHKTQTEQDVRNVVRTIHITNPDNSEKTEKQTVTFTREKTTDLVTNEIQYGDWQSSEQTWPAYPIPTLTGYDTKQSEVPTKAVGPESADETVEIQYSKGQYTINVHYKEKGTQNELKAIQTLNGLLEERANIDFDTSFVGYHRLTQPFEKQFGIDPETKQIEENRTSELTIEYERYEQQNRVIIKNGEAIVKEIPLKGRQGDTVLIDSKIFEELKPKYDLPSELPTRWQVDANNNSEIIVQVTPKIQRVPEEKTIERTIYVQKPDGSQEAIKQEVRFHREQQTNLVTDEVTYTPWQSENNQFPELLVTFIEGYQPSIAKVEAKVVTPEMEPEVVIVTYQPLVETTTKEVQTEDEVEQKEFKRNIFITKPDGSIEKVVQSVKASRTGRHDLVTNEWIPTSSWALEQAEYPSYQPKAIENYEIAEVPKLTIDENQAEDIDVHIAYKVMTNEKGTQANPETTDQGVQVKPETTDQSVEAKPETTDQSVQVQPEVNDQSVEAKPDVSDRGVQVHPETIDSATQANPETTDQGVQVKPETTDQSVQVQPEVNDQSVEAKPDVSDQGVQVHPETNDSSTQVNPEVTDNGTQVQPDMSENGSQTESNPATNQGTQTKQLVKIRYQFADGRIYQEYEDYFDIGSIIDASDLRMLPDNMRFEDEFMYHQVIEGENQIVRIVKMDNQDQESQTVNQPDKEASTQTDRPSVVENETQTEPTTTTENGTQTENDSGKEADSQTEKQSVAEKETQTETVTTTEVGTQTDSKPEKNVDVQTNLPTNVEDTQGESTSTEKETQTEPNLDVEPVQQKDKPFVEKELLTNSNGNSSVKHESELSVKEGRNKRTLPKTGMQLNGVYTLFGFVLVLFSLIAIKKRKNMNK